MTKALAFVDGRTPPNITLAIAARLFDLATDMIEALESRDKATEKNHEDYTDACDAFGVILRTACLLAPHENVTMFQRVFGLLILSFEGGTVAIHIKDGSAIRF